MGCGRPGVGVGDVRGSLGGLGCAACAALGAGLSANHQPGHQCEVGGWPPRGDRLLAIQTSLARPPGTGLSPSASRRSSRRSHADRAHSDAAGSCVRRWRWGGHSCAAPGEGDPVARTVHAAPRVVALVRAPRVWGVESGFPRLIHAPHPAVGDRAPLPRPTWIPSSGSS